MCIRDSFDPIAFDEADLGAENQVPEPEPPSGGVHFPGTDAGEPVYHLEVMIQIGVGVMPELAGEGFDRALYDHHVVGFLSSAVALVFQKQTEFDIRIPFPVTDPFAKVEHLTRKFICQKAADPGAEVIQDLIAQGGGDFLIRIQKQYPVMGGKCGEAVSLGDIATPLFLVDLFSVFFADVYRAVFAETVQNDDFVTKGQALEAATHIVLLVEGHDTG